MTVDLILLLILIVFVLSGYRRGLILSLCSLLILIISCLGGSVAQEVLTPRVAERITPQVTEIVEQQLESRVSAENILEDSGLTGTGTQLDAISGLLGIDLDAALSSVAENATQPLISAAASAIAQALVDAFAGMLIFLSAFLIIYLLLHSLELGLNMVDRLPVIRTLNHLGGGVIGFLSGAFLLFIFSALLKNTELLPADSFSGPISQLLQAVVAKFLG